MMKNYRIIMMLFVAGNLSACATYGGRSITRLDTATKASIIDTCEFLSKDPEYVQDDIEAPCREKRYVEHIEDQMAAKDRRHELFINTTDAIAHTISDGLLLNLDNKLNKDNDDDFIEEKDDLLDEGE